MEEVICYLKEEYGFSEIAKDTEEYVSQYDSLKTAFILQYEPELLEEYADRPKLTRQDEEGLREFQKQVEIREQKAREIPEEKFPLGFHILKKAENESEMHFYIESRFGYLGGGFSSSGKDGTRTKLCLSSVNSENEQLTYQIKHDRIHSIKTNT